jgi:hypothetical protein
MGRNAQLYGFKMIETEGEDRHEKAFNCDSN